MAEKNMKNSTKTFLDSLYKNVKMGADSIIDLMPKVADDGMRKEMTCELEQYEAYAKEIRALMFDAGEEPKEEGFVTKTMSKMGMSFNTMIDASTSHIADLMIKGTTMGVTDTTKLVRESENTDCSENALELARKTIKFEEESIENLKKFL